MGISINATFGYGLLVPSRDWTITYGMDGEEYEEHSPYEFMEHKLDKYAELAYEVPYYYEPYDEGDVAVFITSTTSDFYWTGPHEISLPEVPPLEFSEGFTELHSLAEELGIPFEPKWLLTMTIG